MDLSIDADRCVAAATSRLAVDVYDANDVLRGTLEEPISFPTGVRIRDAGRGSGWRAVVRAYDEGGTLIGLRSATGTYDADTWPESGLRQRRLVFDRDCFGVSCREGFACRAGRCVPPSTEDDPEPSSTGECPSVLWVGGPGAADEGRCDERSAPCATLGYTLATHGGEPGPLIFIHGGTYQGDGEGREAVLIDQGGTSALPLVVRAQPETGAPTFDGGGTQNTIRVGASHVVLDGLVVIGGSAQGIQVNGDDIDDVSILRCEVHSNGIGAANLERAGISTNNGASGIRIAECEIHDNGGGGGTHGIYSIQGNGGTTAVATVVEDCLIYDNSSDGVVVGMNGATLRGNRVMGHNRNIDIWSNVNGLTVEGNFLCDAGQRSVYVDGSRGIEVVRNSFVRGNTGVDVVDNGVARVQSNIFVGLQRAIRSGTALDDSHNLFFDNAEDRVGSASSQPETDVFADPLFLEQPERCVFRLSEESPALGAGPASSDIGAP